MPAPAAFPAGTDGSGSRPTDLETTPSQPTQHDNTGIPVVPTPWDTSANLRTPEPVFFPVHRPGHHDPNAEYEHLFQQAVARNEVVAPSNEQRDAWNTRNPRTVVTTLGHRLPVRDAYTKRNALGILTFLGWVPTTISLLLRGNSLVLSDPLALGLVYLGNTVLSASALVYSLMAYISTNDATLRRELRIFYLAFVPVTFTVTVLGWTFWFLSLTGKLSTTFGKVGGGLLGLVDILLFTTLAHERYCVNVQSSENTNAEGAVELDPYHISPEARDVHHGPTHSRRSVYDVNDHDHHGAHHDAHHQDHHEAHHSAPHDAHHEPDSTSPSLYNDGYAVQQV